MAPKDNNKKSPSKLPDGNNGKPAAKVVAGTKHASPAKKNQAEGSMPSMMNRFASIRIRSGPKLHLEVITNKRGSDEGYWFPYLKQYFDGDLIAETVAYLSASPTSNRKLMNSRGYGQRCVILDRQEQQSQTNRETYLLGIREFMNNPEHNSKGTIYKVERPTDTLLENKDLPSLGDVILDHDVIQFVQNKYGEKADTTWYQNHASIRDCFFAPGRHPDSASDLLGYPVRAVSSTFNSCADDEDPFA